MELKLDTSIEYALALEGGGAKGAYQIGAWRALREAGIRVKAISGTSVGALNGAMMVMGDLDKAEDIWRNISYSQVMDVDDDFMDKLMKGELLKLDLRTAAGAFREVLQNRGFDVTPLYEWMKTVVDEDRVRSSPIELYITTYSVSEQKELELRAKELAPGTLHDMLLASAYLPVFHSDRLSRRSFADGGVRDVLPLHVLLENGYTDIIALRLFGIGLERRVRIPKNVNLYTVAPWADLGGALDFNARQSQFNITAGYYDAQRLLYGLSGKKWYIDAHWPEEDAYTFLKSHILSLLSAREVKISLRQLHEAFLPRLARLLDARQGDYRALFIALLESAAGHSGAERWRIYTEDELLKAVPADFCTPELEDLLKEARRGKFADK